MLFNSIFAFYLNSYWSGRFINYSMREQIKDIVPSFIIALLTNSVVYITGLLINLPSLSMLVIQIVTGIIVFISICELIKSKDYLYVKTTILTQVNSIRKND